MDEKWSHMPYSIQGDVYTLNINELFSYNIDIDCLEITKKIRYKGNWRDVFTINLRDGNPIRPLNNYYIGYIKDGVASYGYTSFDVSETPLFYVVNYYDIASEKEHFKIVFDDLEDLEIKTLDKFV